MDNKHFISDSIGETLLITLYMKSKETNQKNPILIDHSACQLVSEIDYDFSKFDKIILSYIGTLLRASYFDKQLIEFINNKANPVVVLVGCGLDSRVERIGSHRSKATFYQLDIPEVMQIRERLLSKRDNEHHIHASMLEKQWLEQVRAAHPQGDFLFIIEGVVMYFEEIDVKSVFQNLANTFNNGEILCDIPSVWSHKNSNNHDAVKLMRAGFKFGLDDDKDIEKWAANINHVSTKLYSEFPEWKRAGWQGWIMKKVPKFSKAHRLVHYRFD